jgi:hypothetical protein
MNGYRKHLPKTARSSFDKKHDHGLAGWKARVGREQLDFCWRWSGASRENRNGKRYSVWAFRDGSEVHNKAATHVSLEVYNQGNVAMDYHAHHICENNECVNPDHLLVVSRRAHEALHAIKDEEARVAKALELKKEMQLLFDRGARLMA